MKAIVIFFVLILTGVCARADITIQDLRNASYHLPEGYSGEGRGEVATIDKSHTVKFVNGRGEDSKYKYWICGMYGTPDYTKTNKANQYHEELLPLAIEDRPLVCIKGSTAAVIVMQTDRDRGGRQSFVMVMKENNGTLEHVFLKSASAAKYFVSVDIQSDKIIYVSRLWDNTDDSTNLELYEKKYPTKLAPPPRRVSAPRTYSTPSAPSDPTYESNGVMRNFLANMNYSNVVKLPNVPFILQGPMVAVGLLPAGGKLKLDPQGQYVGKITQKQVVLSDMIYPILEVYSASDQDGAPNMFLYCRGVTLGFNDAQEIVKNKVGGRLWVKVVHQGSGEYYQLIIK